MWLTTIHITILIVTQQCTWSTKLSSHVFLCFPLCPPPHLDDQALTILWLIFSLKSWPNYSCNLSLSLSSSWCEKGMRWWELGHDGWGRGGIERVRVGDREWERRRRDSDFTSHICICVIIEMLIWTSIYVDALRMSIW